MYLPENSSLVCDLRAILAYRGSRNFPTPLLSSPKMGRWVRFTPKSAPIVPKDGTMGALYSLKCSYRPQRWTDGRVLPHKVLLPVQVVDRWARFSPQSAPTGPSCGPAGAPAASAPQPVLVGSVQQKRKHRERASFFSCVSKQVMLPCVNHDAGRDGRHRDGHRHDAHDARHHVLSWLLLMQTRLRSG